MKIGFTLRHHDHDYVERRGGFELLSYMRAADGRAAYRRAALDRAVAGFEARSATEACAAGLVVLQRALLCAEDLGRLLYALTGPEPWSRLRTATRRQIDHAFKAIVMDGGETRRSTFRLPTTDQLAEEGFERADQLAVQRLCALADARRQRMLESAAHLWLGNASVAKATMHGLPVLAGEHIVRPPGAGEVNASVRDPGVPFAVVLSTVARDREVKTEALTLRMGSRSVATWHREGKVAMKLYADLSAVQAESIMNGCAAMVPTSMVRRLSADDRRRIDRLDACRQKSEHATT